MFSAFILAGVTNTPLGTIFKGVLLFVIADFFHIALLVAVPWLSLFRPRIMQKQNAENLLIDADTMRTFNLIVRNHFRAVFIECKIFLSIHL